MKKLICLLGHSTWIMTINQCKTEEFQNKNRKITVYKCKHCGEDVCVRDRGVIENTEHNEAVKCKDYKDKICLKDNEKCYLKKINDDGLSFDCIKLIF